MVRATRAAIRARSASTWTVNTLRRGVKVRGLERRFLTIGLTTFWLFGNGVADGDDVCVEESSEGAGVRNLSAVMSSTCGTADAAGREAENEVPMLILE